MRAAMMIAIAGMAIVQCQSMRSRSRAIEANIHFQKEMNYCNSLLTNESRVVCFTMIADGIEVPEVQR